MDERLWTDSFESSGYLINGKLPRRIAAAVCHEDERLALIEKMVMLLQVQPKYYLTACLMFKDAAPYLDEWLRFHCRVGFDHFYLYDNDSSDDYTAVLRPLQDRGHITLHGWPGASQQERAFQHAIDNYRHEARWMAFLDDDEFLFSPQNANLP